MSKNDPRGVIEISDGSGEGFREMREAVELLRHESAEWGGTLNDTILDRMNVAEDELNDKIATLERFAPGGDVFEATAKAYASLESQLKASSDLNDYLQLLVESFESQVAALTKERDEAKKRAHALDAQIDGIVNERVAALRAENDRLKGEREQSRIGYKTAGSTEDTP